VTAGPRRALPLLLWLLAAMIGLLPSCRCDDERPELQIPSAGRSPSASASGADGVSADALRRQRREGSSIAFAREGKHLWVADEARAVLWRLALPLHKDSRARRFELPGPPAQLIALTDGVLVTVRQPSLLLRLRWDGQTLKEVWRTELADDAWGLALTANGVRALVSSAWGWAVSAVAVADGKLMWSLPVAREPRAIVVPRRGTHAYVSHLMGSELTRIDGIGGSKPKVKRVRLAAARSRAPLHKSRPRATLGYSLVRSPDDGRVFAPRMALGARAAVSRQTPTWFGAGTVDVLLTANDKPLASVHVPGHRQRVVDLEPDAEYQSHPLVDEEPQPLSLVAPGVFVQPRAAVFRNSSRSLLIADEGYDRLVELDADTVEPALSLLARYPVGRGERGKMHIAERGGAPGGIALSSDEQTAYLFCQSTFDVVAVPLRAHRPCASDECAAPDDGADRDGNTIVHLADDPLLEGVDANDDRRPYREAATLGRGLFFNASDSITSGGFACAGCHPDGRDDGHTWTELKAPDGHTIFVANEHLRAPGAARQTPMLAGRVSSPGPYGWHAESKTIDERIAASFGLHRWDRSKDPYDGPGPRSARALALAAFLRRGLLPPPKLERELSATEQRGKALFLSPSTQCSSCHDPQTELTDRMAVPVKIPQADGFTAEPGKRFKTPSLFYVAKTPPYFHNGSVASLATLIEINDDRMGKTNQLGAGDKAALVAYLETL
jgi:mono/diheme cytochrome c family protein